MRTRPILIGSLALNVLLALLWLASRNQPHPVPSPESEDPVVGSTEIRTNVVVRRQFFSWEELESEDYPTYIANLRSINCPEETIQDIIIADVDDLFQQRRRNESLPASQQWWQSAPNPQLKRAEERLRAMLAEERGRLLAKLLGPDWALPLEPTPTIAIKVPLEGPILGTLSAETQQAVQMLSGQMQRGFEQLLTSSNGEEPDPAALASLETQLRDGLRPLLNRSQLEEFLLRYSPAAHRLRDELAEVTLFNATDVETRTILRNLGQIDLQLMSLTGQGAQVEAQRAALLRNREIAFRNALGPARYREFLLLQDPSYESAVAAAQAAGVTSASALFYAIDQAGQLTEAEIRANPALTPLQQEMAVREMEVEQLKATAAVLGEPTTIEPPPLPQRTYSFQRGDTIADVSRRTGVPVALILRANPDLQPEGIRTGTEIIIPQGTPTFP